MNIVLVRQGTKFPVQYVRMLLGMLKDHPIWTLTDQPDTPGNTLPLLHGLPGWWSKIELFAPEYRSLRPFLFLDLDTYILGDISDMLAWKPDRLAMLADFYAPQNLASGVMVVPDYDDGIWAEFDRDKHVGMGGGDQAFIGSVVPDAIKLQEHFGGIVSYKVHGPDSGRIVCFHGPEKPHVLSDEHKWARDVWNRY